MFQANREQEVDWRQVSQGILQLAHSDLPLTSFLDKTVQLLSQLLGCDAVDLWVKWKDRCLCMLAHSTPGQAGGTGRSRCRRGMARTWLPQVPGKNLDRIKRLVAKKQVASTASFFSKAGGLWCHDRQQLPDLLTLLATERDGTLRAEGIDFRSLAVLPLTAAGQTIGLLQMKYWRLNSLRCEEASCFENVARTLSVALLNQVANAERRERIKELTCLYSITQLAERPGASLEEVLQGIVELLPGAWQYPEVAAARIVLDGRDYRTANFAEFVQHQSTDLVVSADRRGFLQVVYLEQKPELDEGPFLNEERTLIEAVARHIALIVERQHVAQEKLRLQDQLRHADRLATIGQLAAGVAHELNEPLGNILAFAQLAEKQPGLPSQSREDLGRIVAASLHAREVIKKLMLFARQMPLQKCPVDLNGVIDEGLFFLGSRCTKQGVSLKRRLAKRLPRITADPSQLHQVLTNLVVNALQAMPAGGTLTIATRAAGSHVTWSVADDGIGMDEEVLKKIFIPFFTTKDVHEGTGLGLPVVHGIITSHGGTIRVHSEPGRGTRVEIRLPVTLAEADQEEHSHETSLKA